MRALRSYTTEQVMGLPAELWVKATSHLGQVREMEREMALMFPEREMLKAVRDRNRAQQQAGLYEKNLCAIARAAGCHPIALRSRDGDPGWELENEAQLDALVARVVRDLAAFKEIKQQRTEIRDQRSARAKAGRTR